MALLANYLYPESRLIVCVGLWQFSHDFHPADRTRVAIFWWRTAAHSLQQHGVFTHCGFTIMTLNEPPDFSRIINVITVVPSANNGPVVYFHKQPKTFYVLPAVMDVRDTEKLNSSHLRQIQIRLHRRWCRSAERHRCPGPKCCHLHTVEAP